MTEQQIEQTPSNPNSLSLANLKMHESFRDYDFKEAVFRTDGSVMVQADLIMNTGVIRRASICPLVFRGTLYPTMTALALEHNVAVATIRNAMLSYGSFRREDIRPPTFSEMRHAFPNVTITNEMFLTESKNASMRLEGMSIDRGAVYGLVHDAEEGRRHHMRLVYCHKTKAVRTAVAVAAERDVHTRTVLRWVDDEMGYSNPTTDQMKAWFPDTYASYLNSLKKGDAKKAKSTKTKTKGTVVKENLVLRQANNPDKVLSAFDKKSEKRPEKPTIELPSLATPSPQKQETPKPAPVAVKPAAPKQETPKPVAAKEVTNLLDVLPVDGANYAGMIFNDERVVFVFPVSAVAKRLIGTLTFESKAEADSALNGIRWFKL